MKIHKIEKGETLEIIAKKYNLKVDNLIEDNKIKERNRLGPGNILKIRESNESPERNENAEKKK